VRASSYNIYVDLPGQSHEVLLVHGYSGAYDSVDTDVANYVRSLESRRPPKPLYGSWTPESALKVPVRTPSDQTVLHLRRRGYLTELSEDDEESFFEEVVAALHDGETRGGPAYILMTTYDCNLRCAYCFQDHMRTDDRYRHLLRSMSDVVVDRIVSAFPLIEEAHGVAPGTPRNITFFGGEPLLRSNRHTVEYIMAKLTTDGAATFSAVTNATELDAYQDLLGPRDISALQITLDGPPAQHDKRRVHIDGSGSFLQIAANIDLALSRGVQVEVRTNVDRTNLANLPALAKEIVSRGWHNERNFMAYTAPISASNDKTERRTTLTSWDLDKELALMREQDPVLHVISRPDEGLLYRIRRIFSGQSDAFENFRASYCGAHGRMYVFDAFADIYACWEKTGDPRIRIGHIGADGSLSLVGLNQVWRSRTVASNPTCRRCRFALYCGGGCAVRALQSSGNMFRNYCDGFQFRFRDIAAEAYSRRGREDASVMGDVGSAASAWLSERTLRA